MLQMFNDSLITHHQQTDANETGRGTLYRRAPLPGGAGAVQSALQSQHRQNKHQQGVFILLVYIIKWTSSLWNCFF